jgi:hypothetical protein
VAVECWPYPEALAHQLQEVDLKILELKKNIYKMWVFRKCLPEDATAEGFGV